MDKKTVGALLSAVLEVSDVRRFRPTPLVGLEKLTPIGWATVEFPQLSQPLFWIRARPSDQATDGLAALAARDGKRMNDA